MLIRGRRIREEKTMSHQKRRILIKGGTVVTETEIRRQDLLIKGEKICAIGRLESGPVDLRIEASGLLVLPGAVDTHVHFNDAFMGTVSVHDFESGTRAAAFGGVTAVVDFSNQEKNRGLTATIERKKEEARERAIVDWGVHPVITRPAPETVADIPGVVEAGAPTIKCYLTYREEGLMVEAKELKTILQALQKAGGMLMVHAEDNDSLERNIPQLIGAGKTRPIYHARSRPPEVEAQAIRRSIEAVRETNGRLFVVHLASDEGLDAIAAARAEGLEVFAETCTHYLIFTESMLERDDGIKWICSPPLRSRAIQDKLWEGLKKGTIGQVSSDDAAYSWEAKLLGAERFDKCPNGIPGIEVRLPLLFSEGVAKGRLSLPRMVELLSTAPARFFGLAPQKGSLSVGADADIVLFDPFSKWIMGRETLHMAADWSAYENIPVKGKVVSVFSRGERIIDDDKCFAERGRGRYIHRRLNYLKKLPQS